MKGKAKWTSLYFMGVTRFQGNGNLKFILRAWTDCYSAENSFPEGEGKRERDREGERKRWATKLRNEVCSLASLYARVRVVLFRSLLVEI